MSVPNPNPPLTPLTEREQRLVDSFKWLANVHHEVQHRAMIDQGRRTYNECDARTCKHAAATIAWAEAVQSS